MSQHWKNAQQKQVHVSIYVQHVSPDKFLFVGVKIFFFTNRFVFFLNFFPKRQNSNEAAELESPSCVGFNSGTA